MVKYFLKIKIISKYLNFFEFSNSIQGRTELNSIEVLSKRKRNRDKIDNENKENSEEKN